MIPSILIVGFGRIGKRHAEHVVSFAKLGGIVENNEERLQEAKQLFSTDDIPIYSSLTEVPQGACDIAAICTPNGRHYEDALTCLNLGLNVLVEKPLTLDVRQALSLLSHAETLNLRVFAVKQNRFNPPVEYVHKLLADKTLGKIYGFQLNCFWNRNEDYYRYSDWKGTLELDGGVLFTQFSHFIDLLIWLLGDMEVEFAHVARIDETREIEIEDSGAAVLKSVDHNCRGTMNYTINAHGKNMEGSMTIFGERGTVKIGGQYLNELEYFNVEGHETPELAEGNTANNYGSYTGSMSNHNKVYEHLVAVLDEKATIKTSGVDAIRSIILIQDIYEKANYWNT